MPIKVDEEPILNAIPTTTHTHAVEDRIGKPQNELRLQFTDQKTNEFPNPTLRAEKTDAQVYVRENQTRTTKRKT